MFAVAMFFLLFMLIMIGVKSSKDGRSGVQNGFWGIKILLVLGGAIGAFFIPAANTFSTGLRFFGIRKCYFWCITFLEVVCLNHTNHKLLSHSFLSFGFSCNKFSPIVLLKDLKLSLICLFKDP